LKALSRKPVWSNTLLSATRKAAFTRGQFSIAACMPASRPNTAFRVWPVKDG